MFVNSSISASLLIMTHAYNKPEYIIWQTATFKKFIMDEYQFIVFNDAEDPKMQCEIRNICDKLKVNCIDVPQEIHHNENPYLPTIKGRSPSEDCADTVQYMLDTVGFFHQGITVLVDSDMFLIKEISIESIMESYDIAANLQIRNGNTEEIQYFLPNLIFFNMRTFPDKEQLKFNLGMIDGVFNDAGGFTHFYIKTHPSLKWLKTDCRYQLFPNSPKEILEHFQKYPKMYNLMFEKKYDVEFYVNFNFIHFRAGSNWYKMDNTKWGEKLNACYEGLKDVLGFNPIDNF